MSTRTLFDRAYKGALERGHVVHAAAVGMRQLAAAAVEPFSPYPEVGPGRGYCAGLDKQENVYALYRFAEQLVDAAEDFQAGVEPYCRKTFTVYCDSHHVKHTFAFHQPLCQVCGHPFCDLYLSAAMLDTKRRLPVPYYEVPTTGG